MSTNIGGIVFDLDDTLYPHERFVRSGLSAVARYVERRYGIPADLALGTMLRAHEPGRRVELQALCERFGLPVDLVLPDLLTVYRGHAPVLWFFHDAEATLQKLRAAGWRLAVLTNGYPSVQARKVEALGVRDLVDHVVFAAEHSRGGKPHPDAFHEVLRRLDLPARTCVMVGDEADCDIRGGRQAGMRTIRMTRHPHLPDVSGADVVLELLSDVPRAAAALVERVSAHAA